MTSLTMFPGNLGLVRDTLSSTSQEGASAHGFPLGADVKAGGPADSGFVKPDSGPSKSFDSSLAPTASGLA